MTGKYDSDFAKLTAKAGWFHMNQKIAQDWHVNPEYNDLSGNNPAQLDLFTGPNGTGTQLTAAGQRGFNNNWGNCCARQVDLSYTDDALYGQLDANIGKFDVDGSLRVDSIRATGTGFAGVTGPTITVADNLGSANLPSLVAGGAQEVLNYRVHYTSYSFGGLFAFDDNTSLFARISRGGRFNADRRTLGGNFNGDGSLNAQGRTTAVNFVTQQEVGVKRRGGAFGGNYTAELTAFRAQLTDNNYDFTRINNPPPNNNPIISNKYHSYGLEFTGSVHYGHFSVYSTATLISSKIVESSGVKINKVPHALASFTYVISPTYDLGIASVGLTLDGQTSTWSDDGNTVRIPGQSYLNGFLKVRPYKGLELGINANNLFNTLGYRGSGSVGVGNIFGNSAVLGRTFTGSINYRF